MTIKGKRWAAAIRDRLKRQYRLNIVLIDDGSPGPIGERLAALEKCGRAAEAVALAFEIGFEAASAIDQQWIARGLASHMANEGRKAAQLKNSGMLDTQRDFQAYIDRVWPAAGATGRKSLSARRMTRDFMSGRSMDPDVQDSVERQLRTFASFRIALMKQMGSGLAGWKE